jgi:LysM domain
VASLSAHLRQTEAHGRLSFHPDCPICCAERLSGTPPARGFLGRRTQAALLAGVLAASTTAPGVALAQEPDQATEGTIEPEQAGQDPALNPDFDPGGASDDLPYDAPDAPESEPAEDPELGDPGPLEQEPATDIEVPVADAGDEPAEPDVATPTPVATATPTPTPTPPATDPPVSSPPAAPDVEVTPPPAGPVGEAKAERERTRRDHEREQRSPSQASAPAAAGPAESVAPLASSESAPPAAQPAPVLALATRGSAKPGDRVHVVVAGESLWSIARDVLGGNAAPARVAREVNRLWELNRERIATGNPDLLMVGTELRLR